MFKFYIQIPFGALLLLLFLYIKNEESRVEWGLVWIGGPALFFGIIDLLLSLRARQSSNRDSKDRA